MMVYGSQKAAVMPIPKAQDSPMPLHPAQFHTQMELGLKIPRSTPGKGGENEMRARYHLERADPTPLEEQRNTEYSGPGRTGAGHSTASRVIPGKRGLRVGDVDIPARENYPIPEGQGVLNHKTGSTYDLSTDKHGNVYDPLISHPKIYLGMGPQFSDSAEKTWSKHATRQRVSSTAVLHTIQPAADTGNHKYIVGPMKTEGSRPAILVHEGTSYLVDGHHRVAEARGRGYSHFEADVLDSSKFPPPSKSLPKVPSLSGASTTSVVDHLKKKHNMNSNEIKGYRKDRDDAGADLREIHENDHMYENQDHSHAPPITGATAALKHNGNI